MKTSCIYDRDRVRQDLAVSVFEAAQRFDALRSTIVFPSVDFFHLGCGALQPLDRGLGCLQVRIILRESVLGYARMDLPHPRRECADHGHLMRIRSDVLGVGIDYSDAAQKNRRHGNQKNQDDAEPAVDAVPNRNSRTDSFSDLLRCNPQKGCNVF
ncbi:MAG TPA: hypothetical protein VGJ01_19820 [Pseudolabrys sp.]